MVNSVLKHKGLFGLSVLLPLDPGFPIHSFFCCLFLALCFPPPRATTLFLALCFFFSLSLNPQSQPSSFTFYKAHCLLFFLLSYCLLCFIVFGGVRFLHEKFIAAIPDVFVSLGGSIWVDDGRAVDNEMWVGSVARTVDTFSCSASCAPALWKEMRANEDGGSPRRWGGWWDLWERETAKCLKNHIWEMFHREVR